MLDKNSKIFLDFLAKRPNKYFIYYDEPEYPKELGNNDELFTLIRFLEKNGYVEYITSSSGTHMGVCLSHKGASYKEIRRLETRERWKERAWGFVSGVLITILAQFIISKIL